jgi:hypothetical protein
MNRLQTFLFKKFSYQIQFSFSPFYFICITSLLYLIWEIYWYTEVGLSFIKWHTHLMPYVYFEILGLIMLSIPKKLSSRTRNIFLAFSSLILACFFIESLLIITGLEETNRERFFGYYQSDNSVQHRNYYHAWRPNQNYWLKTPEFSYPRKANSLGFADMEWPIMKKSHEKRILALGDSFTEGDGTPYDSSYVAILRTELNVLADSFYVMNAGACGSDPFYNYVNLKDRLLTYQPDIIIQ